MKISGKGQSSIEYLVIIGIALMLLIPGIAFFMQYSQETNQEVITNQLGVIGNDILTTSEEMYIYGENSWVTLDISLPQNLVSAKIYTYPSTKNDLVFEYETDGGTSDIAFFPDRFEIVTGENRTALCSDQECDIGLGRGLNRLRVEAINEGQVLLRVVS